MAVNKRKVLDAARKFAQKGAKEKALKEYHTLLKLDPRDAKLHLEIGDAYRRWGQLDEAIAQYARVAEQYQQEGFDARAVAVFKQILNLDPKRYETYVSLSELYQHMGLDAEAIGALQSAADGYHKEGQKREALELLRRMAALDPTNTTSRMKVADLLRQEGLTDEAVAEYDGVAEELLRSGAIDSLAAVYERILEVHPNRVDVLVATARNLIELRNPERAEPFARRALDAAPDAPAHYELLCDVYKALGRVDDLIQVTRSLAKLYRERGDEENAREVIQRLPADEALGLDEMPEIEAGESGGDAFSLDDAVSDDLDASDDDFEMSDEELLDDDEFFESQADVVEFDLEEEVGESPAAAPAPSVEEEIELPDGDPDQLLAEASVYLRYGKTDQAIASLRSIVTRHPGHRAALEKLGEAYAESGDSAAAVGVWTSAAERAGEEADYLVMAELRDRIASLDPAAAAGIAVPKDIDTAGADEPAVDLELDAPADSEADASSSDDLAAAGSDGIDLDIESSEFSSDAEPALEEDVEFEVEVDFGGDDLQESVEEAAESTLGGAGEDLETSAASDEIEIELDDDELGFDDDDSPLEDAAPEQAAAPQPVASLGTSAASAQVSEDLEEGEFYFQQGLYDEAEVIYQRILKIAPNHPSALLRLGEVAQARGQDPAEVTSPSLEDPGQQSAGASASVEAEADEDSSALEDGGASDDADLDAAALDLAAELGGENGEASLELDAAESIAFDTDDVDLEVGDPASETEEAVEIDFDSGDASFEQPLDDDSASLEAVVEEAADAVEEDEDPTENDMVVDVSAPTAPAASNELTDDQTLPMSDLAQDDGEDEFDLAAELRDELEEEDAREAGLEGSETGSTADVGFESIFSDFKKGVSETLNDGDFETRYDLGIAYREMELYDDAIAEFGRCLDSDARRLDSLCMMALCAIDLNRGQDAVAHLEQALALPDVPDAQRTGIHFDLGRAFRCMGDSSRAREAFQSVAAADPDFPGVAEALAGLDEPAEETSSDDLEFESRGESFDDLIAEAEADVPEPEEVFENFDDLVTEDPDFDEPPSADEAPAQVQQEAPVEAEPEPEPSVKKTARRKKISFV